MDKKRGRMPSGVTIRKNRQSESIRIDFTYKGVRCREVLAINVNKTNIKYAGNLLGEIKNKIERGTFHYAENFPNSPKLKTFGMVTSSTTILQYLNDFIECSEKTRKLSHTTIAGYGKSKNALKPLHDILVVKLTPKEVANWVKERNKSVSPKTISNQKNVLELALDQAVTDGVLLYNPARQVNASQYVEKKIINARTEKDEDIDIFTQQELDQIYFHCKPVELNIVQFWVNTGVRSAEWAGLKWEDIDFVKNEVHVIESYSKGITKATKTKSGKRFIPLNDVAISALKRQKELTFLHSSYVFLNRDNKPWEHDSFRKHRWQGRILKAAGVRYRYPYQLRHTFATRHISEGTHLWKLAQWMGHKSVEMIYRHYGNFIESYEKAKTVEVFSLGDSQFSEK